METNDFQSCFNNDIHYKRQKSIENHDSIHALYISLFCQEGNIIHLIKTYMSHKKENLFIRLFDSYAEVIYPLFIQ